MLVEFDTSQVPEDRLEVEFYPSQLPEDRMQVEFDESQVPEDLMQVDICASLNCVHIWSIIREGYVYVMECSSIPNSSTLGSHWPLCDRPAAYVIAQQYPSASSCHCIVIAERKNWAPLWKKSLYSIFKFFLCAFAKIAKATFNCVMSVCPTHGKTSLPLDGFLLKKFGISTFFFSEYLSRKLQVLLKFDKNNSNIHEQQYTFLIISRWNILRMKWRTVGC
jgi:hypothetical protein